MSSRSPYKFHCISPVFVNSRGNRFGRFRLIISYFYNFLLWNFLSQHIDSRFSFARLLSGFLNSAQETRASDFSARVPSWLYALQLVVRGQICAWRTRYGCKKCCCKKTFCFSWLFWAVEVPSQCRWADWQIGSSPTSKGEKNMCISDDPICSAFGAI